MDAPLPTVFLSYRRNVSAFIARAVFQDLRQHGYDVFMDVESIDSGQFVTIILNQIAAREHFLVLLTPGTLDRCREPDDLLRREIEYAIGLRRNVIPILVNEFRFDDTVRARLPETLHTLPDYNGVPLFDTYFTEAMDRLRTRFLSKRAQGIITPAPPQDAPVVQQILAEAAREAAPTTQEHSVAQPCVVTQDIAPRLTNSIGMEFVLIAPGTFLMGSHYDERWVDPVYRREHPIHRVTISQPFYLGMYAVTQGQWRAVMENNPSFFGGDPNLPVESISWDEARAFIRQLNAQEGGAIYRLPTEAEWEYACRAGTTTAYSFGDDLGQLNAYGWYSDNSGDQTHPVGQCKPNAWGLYDMHGNVWEWVQDWSDKYAPEPVTDPQGPASGSARMIRGGSWDNDARSCRSAYRDIAEPGNRDGLLGFRLLRMAP